MALGDRDAVAIYDDGRPVVICEEVTLADFIRNSYLQWNKGEVTPGDTLCTNILIHNRLHSLEIVLKPLGELDESTQLQ